MIFSDTSQNSPLRETVLAIVTTQAEEPQFISETLASLLAQSYPVSAIAVVGDNPRLDLAKLCQQYQDKYQITCRFIASATPVSLAQATQLAAAELSQEFQYYWFLHADSAPDPNALTEMILKASVSSTIGALGVKQLAWNANADGSYNLREVGIRATRNAVRVPEVQLQERDQGQYDHREDVLAVGTAGMLVRSAIYHQVGGLDPDFQAFGEGLEFCRRLHAYGYRVVVVPSAKIRHAQLSLRNVNVKNAQAKRYAQVKNALLATPAGLWLLKLLGYLLLTPLRALAYLAMRDITHVHAELRVLAKLVVSLPEIITARARYPKTGAQNQSLRKLEASFREVRAARRDNRKANQEAIKLAAEPDPLVVQERAIQTAQMRKGAILVAVISLFFMLLYFLPYLSRGVLVGGNLSVDDTQFMGLWQTIFSSWRASEAGAVTVLDPFWLLYLPVLLVGAPFSLSIAGANTLLLYLSVPLSALGAYLSTGRFVQSWQVRLSLALFWIVSPGYLMALHTGAVGLVVVHILLPLLIWAIDRAWRFVPGGLGLTALLLSILSASMPIFAGLSLVLTFVGVIFSRRKVASLFLILPTLGILLPSLLTLSKANIGAFLLSSPGKLHITAVPGEAKNLWDLVWQTNASWNTGNITIFWLVGLGIIAVSALLALFRRRNATGIQAAWILIASGLALAIVFTQFTAGWITQAGQWQAVSGDYRLGLVVAWLGILLVFALASAGLRQELRKRKFGLAQPLALLGVLGLPLGIITVAGTWTYAQLTSEQLVLRAAPAALIPAIAQEGQNAPERTRVLAINVRDEILELGLWRKAGTQLSETPRSSYWQIPNNNSADLAVQTLQQAVAGLVVGNPNSLTEISNYGVGLVLVQPIADGKTSVLRDKLVSALFATAGLSYVTENETGIFWRLNSLNSTVDTTASTVGKDLAATAVVGRATLVSVDTQTKQILPSLEHTVSAQISVEQDSLIVLAERQDPNWVATLDGKPLKVAEPAKYADSKLFSKWQQAWELPASSTGILQIYHYDWRYFVLIAIQVLLGLITIISALPLRPKGVNTK